MGDLKSDLSRLAIPPEDDAIPRALADLERQVGDWAGAMKEANGALAKLVEAARDKESAALEKVATAEAQMAAAANAQAAADAQTAANAQAASQQNQVAAKGETSTSATAPKQESKPDAIPQGKAPTTTAPQSLTPPDIPAPPKITREMLEGDDKAKDKTSKGKGFAARFKRKGKGKPEPQVVDEPVAKTQGPPSDDPDEALLATLDEKTAQALRIKRRLLNKSVRELLDEMQK